MEQSYANFEFSMVAILWQLSQNQLKCAHILCDSIYNCKSIHKISCKCAHVDQSYINFEFSVAAILKILNGGYHKNQVICPDIVYDLLHSWPLRSKISCKYSHADRSYSNLEFSVAAILNFFNGGYYKNQVICLTIKNYQYIKFHAFMTI